MDDAKLVSRIADDRDPAALTELMKRYVPKVTGYLHHQFGHQFGPPEIDDIVNDAAVRLWKYAHCFEQTKRFGPWFLTIAHNRAVDILKDKTEMLPTCDLPFDLPDPNSRYDDEPESRIAWYIEQLEQIIECELVGFEQIVAQADLAAGGRADPKLLMSRHGKTRNNVHVTRSHVWEKIRKLIRQRESLRGDTWDT